MTTQTKHQLNAEIKAMEGNTRCFKATITTDCLDRDAEVVLPNGMDKRHFMENPVLLWMHDAHEPIGMVKALYKTADKTGWEMEATIPPAPEGYTGEWMPDKVWGLVKAGIIRGISIGFIPTESRSPTPKDIEKYGNTVRRVIMYYKLMEVSLVSVPANQEALIHAVSKGLVTAEVIKKTFNIDVNIDKTPEPPAPTVVVPPAPTPPPVVKRTTIIIYEDIVDRETMPENIAAKAVAKANGKLYWTPK